MYNIKSTQGGIYVRAEHGQVNGEAVHFEGAQGADVWAKKDIGFKGIRTRTRIHKNRSKWFGLSSDKQNETNENIEYTKFETKDGDVRLHSKKGDINYKDPHFKVNGDIYFIATKGAARVRNSKLNHHIETKTRKPSVQAPLIDTVQDVLSGNVQNVAEKIDPVIGKARKFKQSKKSGEIASSAFNTGIQGYNTYNGLTQGNYGQQMAQNLGWIPKVNLGLTKTSTSLDYQTVSDGKILCTGTVSFDCETADLKSVPIVAKKLAFNVKHIKMTSHKLHTRQRIKSKSVSLGIGPSGVTDATVGYSKNKMKSIHYHDTLIQVDELSMNAETATLEDTSIRCNTAEGQVEHLRIKFHQDTLETRNVGAMASSTGSAAVQESHTTMKKTKAESEGIHANNVDNLHVGTAYFEDASVTAETGKGLQADKIYQSKTKDSVQTRGFGIAGNVNTILDALSSREHESQSGLHIKHSPNIETVALLYQTEKQNITIDLPTNVPQVISSSSPEFFRPAREKKLPTIQEERYQSRSNPHVYDSEYRDEQYPEETASREKIGAESSFTTVLSENSVQESYVSDDIQIIQSLFTPNNTSEPSHENNTILLDKQQESMSPQEDVYAENNIIADSDWPENLIEEDYVGVDMKVIQSQLESHTTPESNHWVGAVLPEDLQTEENEKIEPFNPSLNMREMGRKNGPHNITRWYQAASGQYTSPQKELRLSRQGRAYSGSTEILLMEGGEAGNGLYYKAHIDPNAGQLNVHGEYSKQYGFKLYSDSVDWGWLGSASYRVDVVTATVAATSNLEIMPTSVSGTLGGEAGIMFVSVSGQYESEEFNFMGFSLKITIEPEVGSGLKIAGEIGAKADAKRLKIGLISKVGMFSPAGGAQARVKIESGIHMPFFEEFPNAFKEKVTDDPMVMSILEKKKNFFITGRPCEEWEHDEFDAAMDNVMTETQIRCWKK